MFAPLNGEVLNGSAGRVWVSARSEAGADTLAQGLRITAITGEGFREAFSHAEGLRQRLHQGSALSSAAGTIESFRHAGVLAEGSAGAITAGSDAAHRYVEASAIGVAGGHGEGIRHAYLDGAGAPASAATSNIDDQTLVFAVAIPRPVRARATTFIPEKQIRIIETTPRYQRGFMVSGAESEAIANAVIASGKCSAEAVASNPAAGAPRLLDMTGQMSAGATTHTDHYLASNLSGRTEPEARSVAVPNITRNGVTTAWQTADAESVATIQCTPNVLRVPTVAPGEVESTFTVSPYLERGMVTVQEARAEALGEIGTIYHHVRVRDEVLNAVARSNAEQIRYRWVGVHAEGRAEASSLSMQIRYRWVGVKAQSLAVAGTAIVLPTRVDRPMAATGIGKATGPFAGIRNAYVKGRMAAAAEALVEASVYGLVFAQARGNGVASGHMDALRQIQTEGTVLEAVAETGQTRFYINAGAPAPAQRTLIVQRTDRQYRVQPDNSR